MRRRMSIAVSVVALAVGVAWAIAADPPKSETLVSAKLASYDEKGSPTKVTVELTNNTAKQITRIQGALWFKDASGKTIDSNGYTADLRAGLEAGKSMKASLAWWTPKPETAKLLKDSPAKVTITFQASSIKYKDGSEDKF